MIINIVDRITTSLIKELKGSITIMSKNRVVGGTCLRFMIDRATTINPLPNTHPTMSVFELFKNKSVIKHGSKRSGVPPGGYWLPQGPFGAGENNNRKPAQLDLSINNGGLDL